MIRHLIASAILVFTLTGCMTVSGRWHEADAALAQRAWPYAQIAYNSYHKERVSTAATPFVLPPRFVLLDSLPNDDVGLAYDIFEERLRGDARNLIFAFRGTEGGPDPFGTVNCDWKHGNLRLHQQERAVGVVSRYLRDGPPGVGPIQNIIFVGHSLGGAIALHNSYRMKGAWAYVFNTSPTFSRPRPYEYNETDSQWRRLSIAQRGEILKLPRLPSREATQVYLPVSCTRGGMVAKHGMLPLALCLTEIAATQGPSGGQLEAQRNKAANERQFSPERLLAEPNVNVPRCVDRKPARRHS